MASEDAILTISITAALLKLHPRTIMLYEKSGLFKPHRTNTQRRLYSKKNLEELQFIKYLTHTEGINIQGSKKIIEAINYTNKHNLSIREILFPNFKTQELI